LELLGCTANEDKLQDEVAVVLAQFRLNHVKISMITGDKTETAINIAKSCGIVSHESIKLFLVDKNDATKLNDYRDIVEQHGYKCLFCISGDCFKYVMDNAVV